MWSKPLLYAGFMPDAIRRVAQGFRELYLSLEEKPLVIVLLAAGATIAVAVSLASYAGWPHVSRLVVERHSWAWLLVCLAGELVAYRLRTDGTRHGACR
jgi:hypothetical protein